VARIAKAFRAGRLEEDMIEYATLANTARTGVLEAARAAARRPVRPLSAAAPRLRRANTRLAAIEQGDRTHRQSVAQDLWSRRLRQWRDGVPADVRAGLRPSDAELDRRVASLRRRRAAAR
jgi:hypothetical protein